MLTILIFNSLGMLVEHEGRPSTSFLAPRRGIDKMRGTHPRAVSYQRVVSPGHVNQHSFLAPRMRQHVERFPDKS